MLWVQSSVTSHVALPHTAQTHANARLAHALPLPVVHFHQLDIDSTTSYKKGSGLVPCTCGWQQQGLRILCQQ